MLDDIDYSFGQIKMKDENTIQFIEYDDDEDDYINLVYNINKNKIFDVDELYIPVSLENRIKHDNKDIMYTYFDTIVLKEAENIIELRIISENYIELVVNGAQIYYSLLDEFNISLDKHIKNIIVELNKIYEELQNIKINDYIIEDAESSVLDIVCRITLTRYITVEGFADDKETAKSQASQNINRLIKMIKYFADAIS